MHHHRLGHDDPGARALGFAGMPHGPRGRRGPGRSHHPEGGPGPHRGGPHLGFRGRGRSARRGDVRSAILALLAETPMHGYQIITELGERSGGEWRPSAGSVYPTLQQLEDEGLVRSEASDGRRVMALTDAGREAAEAARRTTPPWASTAPDGAPDLRRVASQVMAAMMQVRRDGTPEMQARAYRLLSDCRRELYRMLADDESSPDA